MKMNSLAGLISEKGIPLANVLHRSFFHVGAVANEPKLSVDELESGGRRKSATKKRTFECDHPFLFLVRGRPEPIPATAAAETATATAMAAASQSAGGNRSISLSNQRDDTSLMYFVGTYRRP